MRVRLTRITPTVVAGAMEPVEGNAVFPPILGKPFRVMRDNGVPLTLTDAQAIDDGPALGTVEITTLTGVRWFVEVIDGSLLALSRRYEQA